MQTEVQTNPTAHADSPTPPRHFYHLIALVGLQIVIFASRVALLPGFDMDADEVWSVWQTFGSPADIIRWTPYDWSPLYYLLVGGWRALTGLSPFTLRLMSVFIFMIALALLYRVARRLFNSTTGIIAVAACAAFGFAINISVMLRAYDALFCVAVLSWWLTLRYFHRPTIQRGLLLGVSLAIMLYLHVTAVFAVGMLALFALIVYRRQIWRGWLPLAIFLVLSAPELIGKFLTASSKTTNNAAMVEQWLAGGATILWGLIRDLLVAFAGYNFPLWAALFGIATFVILDKYRLSRRIVALGAWVIAPLFLFVMGFVGGYTNRHTSWLMAAFAIWIGAGLRHLPRSAMLGVLAVLIVIMFGPIPVNQYKKIDAPLVSAFDWLAPRLHDGDSVLIDPQYKDVAPEEWDYFTRAYFPAGLTYISNPGTRRRVWYISGADQPALPDVTQNRTVIDQFSQDKLRVQLYEAPPDLTGIDFGDGLRFHGVDALDTASPIPVWREGETMHLRLWWSVDQPLAGDLSEGTYVLNGADKLAQFDGAPQTINGPQQTSQWQPGQYYIEERPLTLAYPLAMADYTVQIAVYQSWDGKRFLPPDHPDGLLPILQFHVMSWSSPH